MATAIRRNCLPLERIGLEACSLTAWLYGDLRAAGLPAVCIETRFATAATKTMPTRLTATTLAPSPKSCAPAGTGKSTSSRASPASGARSWWRAAHGSTKCERSRMSCGPSGGCDPIPCELGAVSPCRASAAAKNFAHSASPYASVETAPSNPGPKHLVEVDDHCLSGTERKARRLVAAAAPTVRRLQTRSLWSWKWAVHPR